MFILEQSPRAGWSLSPIHRHVLEQWNITERRKKQPSTKKKEEKKERIKSDGARKRQKQPVRKMKMVVNESEGDRLKEQDKERKREKE